MRVELQHEIDRDSARYIRHSLKASGSGSSSSSSSVPPSPSSKLIQIPAKISSAYTEIQELAEEKEELARRLVALIERAQTRLDIELAKVRALSGDTTDYSNLVPKPLAGLSASMDSIKNPALSMTESLKNALAGTPISEQRQTTPLQPSSPVSTSVAGSNSHKRQFMHLHDFFHNGRLAMDALFHVDRRLGWNHDRSGMDSLTGLSRLDTNYLSCSHSIWPLCSVVAP